MDRFELRESCNMTGLSLANGDLLKTRAAEKIQKMLIDGIDSWAPKLSVGRAVVDFSSPSILKQMEIGNLRSTLIGDSIARMLEFSNVHVLRRNHVGDSGIQFGTLIQFLFEEFPKFQDEEVAIGDIQAFVEASQQKFHDDSAFRQRALKAVLDLQHGEAKYRKAWGHICDVSRKEFVKVYQRLGVQLEEKGESFYSPYIPGVIDTLRNQGLVEESEGAHVISIEGISLPPISGFNYASTDLAALWYRLNKEKAEWIIYVTEVGQQHRFDMVFKVAKRVGWLPVDDSTFPKASHVGFGLVLGDDVERFKTRPTGAVQLVDLLDEAKIHSKAALVQRGNEKNMTREELEQTAEAMGYGAMKYGFLENKGLTNYELNYEQMFSVEFLDDKGNTGVYLLHFYSWICSIIRKSGKDMEKLKKESSLVLVRSNELALGLHLVKFSETVVKACTNLSPNLLCEYLDDLLRYFLKFHYYFRVDGPADERKRLLLCEATAMVMNKCFSLLGIVPLCNI